MEKMHRKRPCVFLSISIGSEDPIYAHPRVLTTAQNLLAFFAGLTLIFSILRTFSYGSHKRLALLVVLPEDISLYLDKVGFP